MKKGAGTFLVVRGKGRSQVAIVALPDAQAALTVSDVAGNIRASVQVNDEGTVTCNQFDASGRNVPRFFIGTPKDRGSSMQFKDKHGRTNWSAP